MSAVPAGAVVVDDDGDACDGGGDGDHDGDGGDGDDYSMLRGFQDL